MAGHWAATYMASLRKAAIISGYPDGTFRPDAPVSRAEVAKVLALALGWM